MNPLKRLFLKTQAPPKQYVDALAADRDVSGLVHALGDERPVVRKAALAAIADLEDERVLPILVKDGDAWRQAHSSVIERLAESTALAALIPLTTDRDPQVRDRSICALQAFGDAACGTLIFATQDEDADVRASAVLGLGLTRSATAVSTLVAAMNDPAAEVRRQAASALSRTLTNPPGIALPASEVGGAVQSLLTALEDSDARVRAQAALALGSDIARPQALPALLDHLTDPDAAVRARAALALGGVASPDVVAALTATLKNDHDPAVRRQCAWALGRSGSKEALSPLKRRWVVLASGAVTPPTRCVSQPLARSGTSATPGVLRQSMRCPPHCEGTHPSPSKSCGWRPRAPWGSSVRTRCSKSSSVIGGSRTTPPGSMR